MLMKRGIGGSGPTTLVCTFPPLRYLIYQIRNVYRKEKIVIGIRMPLHDIPYVLGPAHSRFQGWTLPTRTPRVPFHHLFLPLLSSS